MNEDDVLRAVDEATEATAIAKAAAAEAVHLKTPEAKAKAVAALEAAEAAHERSIKLRLEQFESETSM